MRFESAIRSQSRCPKWTDPATFPVTRVPWGTYVRGSRWYLIGMLTRPLLALAVFTLAAGCVGKDDDVVVTATDADEDGFTDDVDCDDGDAAVNPNAEEICDGVDNDCDGTVDQEVTQRFFSDADGDGFGDPTSAVEACEQPEGAVTDDTDCDDASAESYPDAPEQCDGLDNDCDGVADEDVLYTWYADADGDGFGDPDSAYETCDPPEGYVADDTDCDDTEGTAYPGADEVCDGLDNDCDGAVDEDVTRTVYADADGDGFGDPDAPVEACEVTEGFAGNPDDCDDTDGSISPNAVEICDDVDNDCDGSVDADAIDQQTFYADTDGDGFGDPTAPTESCDTPSGYVSDASDCDDGASAVNPDAVEVCDDADNDCDGDIDSDATDKSSFYADSDGDGYGSSVSTTACDLPSGYADVSGDCDDGDDEANPGETEVCDGTDNDCDGDVDEGLKTTYYLDDDGDGFGNADQRTDACETPAGYTDNDDDCDDTDGAISPNAAEVCDEVDNDCDGDADSDAIDRQTFYADSDGDGFGDAATTTESCDTPSGYVADSTDCDDAAGAVNPDATEVCDEVDNDCDGDIDSDATDKSTFYADGDGDGYGSSVSTTACDEPSGYAAASGDCDDADDSANPGETETCDGVDNDCDGDTDEGLTTAYYIDYDGDGFGSTAYSETACEAPTGYVADDTDCDDSTAEVYPGGTEVCDSLDNDCDGDTDEGLGSAFYLDNDSDGFGNPDVSVTACEAPTGYVADDTDCDDSAAAIRPSATEDCDGVDNDCDGTEDNGVLGSGESCAAETCADILADDATNPDGDYYLDPFGAGSAELYSCDMTTDGGGWTQVFVWDRRNDGDTQSDFETLLTENINDMSNWSQSGSYIQWSDLNATGDVMDFEYPVDVPNDGEALFTVDYYGYSMEQSGTWFYVTAGGSEQDLICAEASTTTSNNCFTATTRYSTAEQAYLPDYTCADEASGNLDWDSTDQYDFGGDEITTFHLTSFMCDSSYGDYSRLYDLELWVR